MLITKQKQRARITSILLVLNSSNGKSVLEVLSLLRYTHTGTIEDAATNRMHGMEVRRVNKGCCHMWDCVCMCERKSQGVNLLLALWCMEKPRAFSHLGIMSLQLQRSYIWYHTEDTPMLAWKEAGFPLWVLLIFRNFRGGLGGVYCYLCLCSSCCVSGDSHAGPLIETPLPRYSVINKRRSKESSKWPFVSDNSTSITMPHCSTNTFIQTWIS